MATATLTEWPARPRREETAVARRWLWTSRCGRYRVVHTRYTLGGLPDLWYAMSRDGGCWDILSRHRKRHAAFAACERAAREA